MVGGQRIRKNISNAPDVGVETPEQENACTLTVYTIPGSSPDTSVDNAVPATDVSTKPICGIVTM